MFGRQEPPGADVAFTALRNNGWDAATARAAVERARAHVGTDAPLADLLRAALRACGELRAG